MKYKITFLILLGFFLISNTYSGITITDDNIRIDIISGIYDNFAITKDIYLQENSNNILQIITNTDNTYYFYPETNCNRKLKSTKIKEREPYNIKYDTCGEITENKEILLKEINTLIKTKKLDPSFNNAYYLISNINSSNNIFKNYNIDAKEILIYLDKDWFDTDIYYYIITNPDQKSEVLQQQIKEPQDTGYNKEILNIFCEYVGEKIYLDNNYRYYSDKLNIPYANAKDCSAVSGKFCSKQEFIKYIKERVSNPKDNKINFDKFKYYSSKNIASPIDLKGKDNDYPILFHIFPIPEKNQMYFDYKEEYYKNLYVKKGTCQNNNGTSYLNDLFCLSEFTDINAQKVFGFYFNDNTLLTEYLLNLELNFFKNHYYELVLLKPDNYLEDEYLQEISIKGIDINKPSLALIEIDENKNVNILEIINDKLKDKSFENDPYNYINFLEKEYKFSENTLLIQSYEDYFGISENKLAIYSDSTAINYNYFPKEKFPAYHPFICHNIKNNKFFITPFSTYSIENIEVHHRTALDNELAPLKINKNCTLEFAYNNYRLDIKNVKCPDYNLYVVYNNNTNSLQDNIIVTMPYNNDKINFYVIDNNKIEIYDIILYFDEDRKADKQIIDGYEFINFSKFSLELKKDIISILNEYKMQNIKTIAYDKSFSALYIPKKDEIILTKTDLIGPLKDLKSTLIHELSHHYFEHYFEKQENLIRYEELKRLEADIISKPALYRILKESSYMSEYSLAGHPYSNENELFASTTTVIKTEPYKLIENIATLDYSDAQIIINILRFVVESYYYEPNYPKDFIPKEILDYLNINS